jgi:hypothetical protein
MGILCESPGGGVSVVNKTHITALIPRWLTRDNPGFVLRFHLARSRSTDIQLWSLISGSVSTHSSVHLEFSEPVSRVPWFGVFIEQLIVPHLVNKFSSLLLSSLAALRWVVTRARSVQFPPSQPIYLRAILILSHLRLALPQVVS